MKLYLIFVVASWWAFVSFAAEWGHGDDEVFGRGLDSFCESDQGGSAQHSQGLRDLHPRPDIRPEGQGRLQRAAVGAVPLRGQGAFGGKSEVKWRLLRLVNKIIWMVYFLPQAQDSNLRKLAYGGSLGRLNNHGRSALFQRASMANSNIALRTAVWETFNLTFWWKYLLSRRKYSIIVMLFHQAPLWFRLHSE